MRPIQFLLIGLLLGATNGKLDLANEALPLAGRITGKVIDRDARSSLPGANVLLEGTSTGAATDDDGVFIMPNVPAGTYTIVVSYIGYERQMREVTVIDGQTIEVDFELVWAGIEGEEILITAQAAGQTAAINQQLSSNTITNIVSAARIQELPDVNAAESIGRLPGVAIQRSGGEANKISIRGLSAKYNTVTVNGVRVPSTSGDDRSVDLSLISSNMLDGIEVMKAITPDKDADAIGGAVDLKLREAPDQFMVDILAQGGYTQLQDYYGNYKINGSVGQRFFGKRLGIIASVNVDEFDRSADKFSGNYRQSSDTQTGAPIILISDIGVREESVKRGRTGASGVVDYRIPKGKITANGFYNRLSFDGLFRVNQMNVDGNRHYYDTELRSGTTSIFTGAVGIEQELRFFRYDVGVSRIASRSDNPEDFVWRFSQEGNAFRGLPDQNTIPTEIPSLLNVDSLSTGLQDVFVYGTRLEEDELATQANVQVPFFLNDRLSGYLKVGGKFRWLDRFNDQTQGGRNGLYYGSGAGNLNEPLECIAGAIPAWDLDTVVGNLGVLPIGLVDGSYSRDDFLEGDYPLGFTAESDMLLQLTEAMRGCGDEVFRDYAIGSLGRDYKGTERYQAGYAMAAFNIGRKLTLTPGVRWEGDFSRYTGQRYRETSPNNVQGPPAELESITTERDNAFWLPMVHLRYQPTAWLTLRLARTETLTRPDYIQYAPITTINSFLSYVSAANALLKPATSVNYDASVSVYTNKVGLFTVSAFHKTIDDLILFVDYNLHPDVGVLPGMNVPDAWINARPRANTYINNPFEATYNGFELDWQTNLWYLPSVLKGIVLSANYTYLQSETTYQAYYIVDSDSLVRVRPPVYLKELRTDSTRTARMPDQPTHIANVTLGYDLRGFSARFSVLYQTDTSTFINSTNPLFDSFAGDYLRYDLSVRQKLLKGLELFANFNNLSGRPDRNFRGAEDANPSYIEYYGFTMDVGARFRY
ncbi:MAG: TonB-dependent receptor [Rhodothermales bacterium]|nr:TonB-dependent receptor [Rhodothermales bacterium]